MGAFQFVKNIIKKILEPAQDPSGYDSSSIGHYHRLLDELSTALNALNSAKQQLQNQSKQLGVRATEILDEAKRVLSDGREDIAKIALKRRRAILRSAVEFYDFYSRSQV